MKMPIYQVIENDIKDQIRSRKLKSGELVQSENQLKEIYGVSRMTVRQALSNLVNEGFLYRYKGKGTFVSSNKIEKDIHGVRGFTEEMNQLGKKVESKIITFEIVEPTSTVKEKLVLDDHESAILIERIRYCDDIPVLYEKLFVPNNLFKELTEKDMKGSFYTYVEKEKTLKIGHCIQIIEAKKADKVVASSLDLEKDDIVLSITRNTFLSSGRPFEYVVSTYRGDQYRFVQKAARE